MERSANWKELTWTAAGVVVVVGWIVLFVGDFARHMNGAAIALAGALALAAALYYIGRREGYRSGQRDGRRDGVAQGQEQALQAWQSTHPDDFPAVDEDGTPTRVVIG